MLGMGVVGITGLSTGHGGGVYGLGVVLTVGRSLRGGSDCCDEGDDLWKNDTCEDQSGTIEIERNNPN